MNITFLRASSGVAPTKRYDTQLGNQVFQHFLDWTSVSEDFNTLNDLCTHLCTYANLGSWVWLKGPLDRPLANEPRAGHTTRTDLTRVLVLDVDGLHQTPEDLLELCQLANTSHIRQHSASSGVQDADGQPVKPGTRMHLIFLLDEPMAPQALKEWLEYINLTHFSGQVALSANGGTLVWPLDLTINQNDKLVYIAPPIIGSGYRDTIEDRISLVTREHSTVPSSLFELPGDFKARARKNSLIKQLRQAAGLTGRAPTIRILASGEEHMPKPHPTTMTFLHTDRGFSYYNIGNGDSNAYYHPVEKPGLISNFKGEPSFLHKMMDRQSYEKACSRALHYKRANGLLQIGILHCPTDDLHYSYQFDPKQQRVELRKIARRNLNDFLANHQQDIPDFIEDWELKFDPTWHQVMAPDQQRINLHYESEYGLKYLNKRHLDHDYENAPEKYRKQCPYIYSLLAHVMNNDRHAIEWFINWFAYIVQVRTKPGTAILLFGEQGTGKNLLFENVLTPIVGADFAFQQRLDQFEKFTKWIKQCRLLLINEVTEIALNEEGSKLGEMLKNIITEEMLTVREMRVDAYSVRTFNACIVGSNSRTPRLLGTSDRRFTVAPRQDLPLTTIGNDISGAIPLNVKTERLEALNALEGELDSFAHLLYTQPYDEARARTALDNPAKDELRELGRTSVDEFCEALRFGDLDFFIEHLPHSPLTQSPAPAIMGDNTAAKSMFDYWIANLGREMIVTVTEMEMLYNMAANRIRLQGQAMRFTKMLGKHGLHVRKNMRDNRGRPVRGIYIRWTLSTIPVELAMRTVAESFDASLHHVPSFVGANLTELH